MRRTIHRKHLTGLLVIPKARIAAAYCYGKLWSHVCNGVLPWFRAMALAVSRGILGGAEHVA